MNSCVRSRTEKSALGGGEDSAAWCIPMEELPPWLRSSPAAVPPAASTATPSRLSMFRTLPRSGIRLRPGRPCPPPGTPPPGTPRPGTPPPGTRRRGRTGRNRMPRRAARSRSARPAERRNHGRGRVARHGTGTGAGWNAPIAGAPRAGVPMADDRRSCGWVGAVERAAGGPDELTAVRVPVVGLLGEHAGEYLVDGGRKFRPQQRRRRGELVNVRPQDRLVQAPLERRPAGEALVEHTSERVLVGRAEHRLVLDLLSDM